MRTLLIFTTGNKSVNDFLNNFSDEVVTLNKNFKKLFFQILINDKKLFLDICKGLFFKPITLISDIIFILSKRDPFYNSIRNTILDSLERETGELCTKDLSTNYLIKKFPNFIRKSIKLLLFIFLVEKVIINKKIKCIFIPQLDGDPFAVISSLCVQRNIYIGSFSEWSSSNSSLPNILITCRKGINNERIALPHDLKKLEKITNEKLKYTIDTLRDNYVQKKDPICNTETDLKKINNEKLIKYYKKLTNNGKKNVVVLLHVFTDQARIRLVDSWYENYLDWFIETAKFCKENNNVNWIFKAHPYENLYPIKDIHSKFVINTIKKNNHIYIGSDKQFLHGEIAELASAIVTCNGTCKIEYPALFEIPVISCIGKYALYETSKQPFTATNKSEYRELILNIDQFKLDKKQIRKAKELLYFFKKSSGVSIKEKQKVFKHFDENGRVVFRNF